LCAALAVALAGLCSIRSTPLASRAWYYVDKHYERSARYVADSRTGMLWKPVEKLYKKASAFRDSAGTTRVPFNPTVDPALQRQNSTAQSSNGTPNGLPVLNNSSSSGSVGSGSKDMNWFAASPTFATDTNTNTNTNSSSSTNSNKPTTTPASTTTPTIFGPNNAAFPSFDFGNLDDMNLGAGSEIGMGNVNDTSWLDWEEMMADFAGASGCDSGMGNLMGDGGMQWQADGPW